MHVGDTYKFFLPWFKTFYQLMRNIDFFCISRIVTCELVNIEQLLLFSILLVMQIGTGFTDADLEKHAIFFKDHVTEKPKPYYRYDSSVEPDHWFDAVQVWEVKCADLSISPTHLAAAGIVSTADPGSLVNDLYNYLMLYHNIKDLKGLGHDFRSKFYFLFFTCKMVYLHIFND